ncbi:MAG: ABC transporter ATP-binding protein/permease [Rivularia sp. ALOHA_DT_140]|nr:ABC transporter ATP-binding protein/permease [Rivularia sp. ALOHA_DT_140]
MQTVKIINKMRSRLRLGGALRLVWQSSPKLAIARLIFLIFQGILPLIPLYLSKLLIDTVAASLNTADKEAAFREAIVLLVLTAVATILTTVVSSLAEVIDVAQGQQVTNHMQSILHAKSIEVDLEYYENSKYYDALQRAQQEASFRPTQIVNRLAQVVQNGISLIAIVGLLLSLHWGIAGILFVAAIPAMLVRGKYSRVIYNWQRKNTSKERQIQYFGLLLTSDLYAKEIRLFELGNIFSKRFDRLKLKMFKESLNIVSRRAIANIVAQVISGILIFTAYTFIFYQTIQGILAIGDLVLYYQAFQKGQNSLQGMLRHFNSLYEDNLFLANLYEFLDLKPKVIEPANPKVFPAPMQSGIVFDNVSFEYSNSNRKALQNVNLTVKPGEVIALVGENGSGKTSLIKLLCRLYDPTAGRITIDGIDIRQFQIPALRQEIGVIFQDYAKYHLTANENIWLGNTSIEPNNNKIIQAARMAGADDVISKLPKRYDTILGKLFEQGEELSIGQWQKIALARAFLRNSQVIVLDEPTSAMDPKAEEEVFRKFRELIQGQAAILISHRLSTVKMADRIYVMEGGKVIENGSHQELMQQNGTYAYLFETQAQNYR